MTTQITFHTDGTGFCLYTEAIDLSSIGRLEITRASTIEYNPAKQCWEVRLASNAGAVVFSHPSRETCLDWERDTLNAQL